MDTSPERVCLRCSKPIEAERKIAKYCRECASEIHREAINRPHVKTCIDCGIKFNTPTLSSRVVRCPECQMAYNAIRIRDRSLAYLHGQNRKIGGSYPCILCGQTFVLASPAQRKCPECAGRKRPRGSVIAAKTCPQCGAAMDSDRALCAKCSHAYLITQPVKHPHPDQRPRQTRYCIDCGAEITASTHGNVKYCSACNKKRKTAREIASRKKRLARLALEKTQNQEDYPNDLQ